MQNKQGGAHYTIFGIIQQNFKIFQNMQNKQDCAQYTIFGIISTKL
jgi:hypothetical protein